MPSWDRQWQPAQTRLSPKGALGMSRVPELGKEPLLHEGHPSAHSQAFVHSSRQMEEGSWELEMELPLLLLAEGVEGASPDKGKEGKRSFL